MESCGKTDLFLYFDHGDVFEFDGTYALYLVHKDDSAIFSYQKIFDKVWATNLIAINTHSLDIYQKKYIFAGQIFKW